MQVPWGWIKQRPQFLAEELTAYYDVTVVNVIKIGEKAGKSDRDIHFMNIYRLPLERIRFILFLSRIFISFQLFFRKKHYDIVWLASPSNMKMAENYLDGAMLVYDCMDDLLAFPDKKETYNLAFKNEKELYQRADYVLASAEYLKNKLMDRYGQRNVCVVNNAVADNIINRNDIFNHNIKQLFSEGAYHITYIGTISEWFDFDLIIEVLNVYQNVVFHLFGPAVVSVPIHERLVHHGPIPHSNVASAMQCSDALIMPFKVTELIKSVNPVKLYEYIAAGKPCMAPEYGESLPFKEYVNLYKNHQHFMSILDDVMKGGRLKSEDERRDFLSNNSWKERAHMIYQYIEG